MKKLPLAIAVSAAILSSNVMAELAPVEFHGYFRAGVGVSGDSGQQVSYEIHNLGRLGNEDGAYTEVGLNKEVFNADGVSFKVNSMFHMASNGSNDSESTKGDDAEFSLRQFNVEATGTLGGEEVVWAGKKYNQRHDVHITDYYYWDISGAGAGIENMKVGPGAFAVSWVRSDDGEDPGNNGGAVDVNVFDVRYAGINLWSGMQLEVGLDYAMPNESSQYVGEATKSGVLGTAEFTQGYDGGWNKTVFQYGTEGYGVGVTQGGSNYAVDAEDGGSGYRFINLGSAELGNNFDFGHMIRYSVGTDIVTGQVQDLTNMSFVIRPGFKWAEHHKSVLELGTYSGDNADGTKQSGQKYTFAQVITAGRSFWARPELRLYVSYLTDGEGESFANNTSDTEYNFGAQTEAWW